VILISFLFFTFVTQSQGYPSLLNWVKQ